MVWGVVAAAVIIGLLSLINAAAANALFSLAVAGNDLAWMMPILCRLVWGQERFHPGVFYTGRFSKPIAVTAIVYLGFAIVLCMFPTLGPGPTRMSSFSFSFACPDFFLCSLRLVVY
jgi:amino acid transporter